MTPPDNQRFHRSTRRLGSTPVRGSHFAALLSLLLLALVATRPASAHVGNKDVFEEVTAGPYRLFVTVRPPTVIPGVAAVEIRSVGAPVTALDIAPVPLIGEASRHPPTPDNLQRSAADPNFFTGSLWIMARGSWQVRLHVTGPQGEATAGVPVPAVPLSTLRMQRPLGLFLGFLGLLLLLLMAGIIAAAVREARLPPGLPPDPTRRRRAAIAGCATLAFMLGLVLLGNKWWNVEAADYAGNIFRPLDLRPTLTGNQLQLEIGSSEAPGTGRGSRRELASWSHSKRSLLLDHGQVMHLYAIRWPQMDAVFHLHPQLRQPGTLEMTLPAMPPGDYKLFADIVFDTGFPETLTADLTVPPGMPATPLAPIDAAAMPPALDRGALGDSYKLPDGYTMVWKRPAALVAGQPTVFDFELLDAAGRPAPDVQPYLGMPGHAAFVKTDGSAFAHTHPEGSAAMPAVMLAEGMQPAEATPGGQAQAESAPDPMPGMSGMSGMSMPGMHHAPPALTAPPLPPEVHFPYGFPSAGRYRIFIQMKHGSTVETGVFDADVQAAAQAKP